MREKGNAEEWDLEVIEDFPCANLTELRQREEHWRKELDAPLNERQCYTTPEEEREKNRVRNGNNYHENRERILARQAEMCEIAKEEKKHYCEACDKAFGTASKLKRHQAGSKCLANKEKDPDNDEKRESDNARRARNAETAKGEKKYYCQPCDKAFGDSYKLKRHQAGVKCRAGIR